MKLQTYLVVLVVILGTLTITKASNQPKDVTAEINSMIPRLQAFVKRTHNDPLSLSQIFTRLFDSYTVLFNGFLHGLSTTDAVVEYAQMYQENGTTYVKGRANVGKFTGEYQYMLHMLDAESMGKMYGESNGATFDFGFSLDHNTLRFATTHFRIVQYQDITAHLDDADQTQLVQNEETKPFFDAIIHHIEERVIETVKDLYDNDANGNKPKSVKDINSVLEYFWQVLEYGARYMG